MLNMLMDLLSPTGSERDVAGEADPAIQIGSSEIYRAAALDSVKDFD